MNNNILAAPLLAESESFAPLLIVLALAVAAPVLIGRINRWLALPVVVGEILLGVILGQIYPALAADPVLEILSEIGFGILFFLAGTEIDFRSLKNSSTAAAGGGWRGMLKSPVPLGIITFLLTLLLSAVVAFALSQTVLPAGNSWLFLVLVFTASSLDLIMTVLKESGYNSQPLGQMILVAGTIADFGTLLILSVVVAVIEIGGFRPEILLVSLVFVGFVAAYLVFSQIYNRNWMQRAIAAINSPTSQVKLRFSFALFLAFVVLSQQLGVEIILGTFLAGLLISLLARPEDKDVVHQLESVGFGFFIPVFFIMVGVRFNLDALLQNPEALLLLPAFIIGAVLVKLIPVLLFRWSFGWRAAIASGILLSTRMSLIIAVGAIGVTLGILSDSVNADIILLAMILVTFGPMAFNRIMPKLTDDAAPLIIVAGAGKFGLEVASQLRGHHEHVVLIDDDPAQVAQARMRGFTAIEGHLDRPSEVTDPYLVKAQRLVTTHTDTDTNYAICRFVRSQYDIEHIVTQVADPVDLERFQRLGVTATNPATDYPALVVMLTRNPAAFDLMTRTDDDKEVLELVVRNPSVIGQRLRDLHLSPGLLVLAVKRSDALLMPTADTRLERDDHVTVIGDAEHLEHAYTVFASPSTN